MTMKLSSAYKMQWIPNQVWDDNNKWIFNPEQF